MRFWKEHLVKHELATPDVVVYHHADFGPVHNPAEHAAVVHLKQVIGELPRAEVNIQEVLNRTLESLRVYIVASLYTCYVPDLELVSSRDICDCIALPFPSHPTR